MTVAYQTDERWLLAVRELSLRVAAGETLAIVGETGSGKSSAVLAIGGLLPRNGRIVTGEVEVNGRDLRSLSGREMRNLHGREIGYVPQLPMAAFNPTMRVGRQVAESLRVHDGLSYRRARPMVLEALRDMGLREPARVANAYPHELSGGMLQRAMIAAATISRPMLLIADEPTSALDAHVRRQILDLLREVQRRQGLAILFVTHDLALIADIADRVLVLYGGRAVESAPTADLFRHPRHPYTRSLLESRISAETPQKMRLRSIKGHPLTAHEVAAEVGCPFRPRCGYEVPECSQQFPLAATAGSHSWSCFNPPIDESQSS
jgi:oligopeptide/dipeptide ABC transporter ATP-binding protein